MNMTVVNSLHWSRGRATGRGAKVTSCAECFLEAAPNRCQPTINRGLLTKVSFLTPSSFSISQSSTLHHDKRIGNSLPTFKAIGIDWKEDVSGIVWKLPVEGRKRSSAFIFNCQRQCKLYPFQWSCTLNAFNIHECKYKHVKENTLVLNTYMNLMVCQHCCKHFL